MNADIATLQLKVATLRNVYKREIEKTIWKTEKEKVQKLETKQYVTDVERLDIPHIKDPFEECNVNNYSDSNDRKLWADMRNQMKLLTILLRKKKCPISRRVDRL